MKSWNDMSREEKFEAFVEVAKLFEDDEKITKIAYDHVNLPYELVREIVMEYLTAIDHIDAFASRA